ncbi:DUF3306 domain-containing protein [Litoreibacter roseus]|uniref:DUF3306 domain-containing protein n=1 Tax=Litoreibacter roseus TaxID=2601869 RepID=A0A6N6JAJ5_9RHOB|nr:DUF3306 domain-containing protein [Litoreibacter roseus]GFE63017.1 hypothetical protein KIN_00910 [Litoreibacter roseus]
MSRRDDQRGDFWSRRRAGVKAEAQTDEAEALAEAEAAERAALEEKTDEQLLEELGLPDPDTLGEGDDFSVFMSKVVPDRLRRRALRKLWLTNPALANLDELVDYGQDFTDSAMVVENMQTAYQVGKGMMRHVVKMAEEAERAADGDAKPEAESVEVAAVEDAVQADEGPDQMSQEEGATTKVEVQSDVISHDDEDRERLSVRPRRMRFSFDGETA